MFLAQNHWIQNTRNRIKGIHGRVDAKLYDLSGEHHSAVKMRKRRSRCRVCQVICRHIHALNRRDRTLSRRRNSLLEFPQVDCQRGLVAHSRGHTTEKGGNLGTCLRKTKNIVNEHEHVTAFLIPEVLCRGQG